MYVVVVNGKKDGTLEITKDDLQKMLDEAYNKGRSDQRIDDLTKPYYTFTTTPSITYYATNTGNTTIDKDKIDITYGMTE